MNIFTGLSSKIANAWAREENNIEGFTNLATRTLENFQYNWSLVKLDSELKTWLTLNANLPKQLSVHNSFGQPSITLFNNDQFVIDLYFWIDFDTSIHSHGFRGAFRVLHGQSLQETFLTVTKYDLADDVRLVDITSIELERLRPDDVRPIAPELDLTHRVIHLENPTVTLCIRTVNEPAIKQWTYLPTGLAVQKQNLTSDVVKKLYFYQYLIKRQPTDAAAFLSNLMKSLNLSTQIHLYEDVASGALDLSEDVVDTIATTIVSQYENSTWWPAYEKAHLDRMTEIRFEEFQDPEKRLEAHFKNCGYSISQIKAFRDKFS